MSWQKEDEPGKKKARQDKEPGETEKAVLVCAKQSDGNGGGSGGKSGKGGKGLKGCLHPPCKGKIINSSSGSTAGSAPPPNWDSMLPLVISWVQMQAYLADSSQVLTFDFQRAPILLTQGWRENAPVQINLRGAGAELTIDAQSNAQGRLDFGLPLAAWELPLALYTLEMSGPRLDGVDFLAIRVKIVEPTQESGARLRREGPGIIRLDPDDLLVYGFLPGDPFRINVYTCLSPDDPQMGGEFFGSAEFTMVDTGQMVIELDFATCEDNAFCFVAEGQAIVPVIAGLRGAGSLDIFQPEAVPDCVDCP